MTPAIRLLEKAKVAFQVHAYAHRDDAEAYGLEAAAALGVDPARVFKTLVAQVDGKDLAMGMIPVAARLNLKALAAAVGGKKADLAEPKMAERATGYVVGGISPLGGRKALPVVIDDSVTSLPSVYFSAGRRGMQIEMSPQELIRVARATVAAITA